MSVNIGTAAVNAIVELRGNKAFEDLVEALGLFAQSLLIASAHSDPAMRVDHTARAYAFHEIWLALDASYTGKHMSQSKPPSPARVKERANAE